MMMKPSWCTVPFDELSVRTLHDLLKLRVDAFVVEQRCAYAEIDGRDTDCTHVLAFDGTQLVACCRIVPPGGDGMPHIGRLVVHPDHRGHGIAHRLMEHALKACGEQYGPTPVALAAQHQLEAFYAQHGFKSTGPVYDWDGIPHVDMVRLPDR